MSTRSLTPHAALRQNAISIPAGQGSLFLQVVGLMLLCSILLVLSVTGVARTSSFTEIPEPPPAYLPGEPVPDDASCAWMVYDVFFCTRHFETFDLYFQYAKHLSEIEQVIIPAQDYRIGDLIAAWGTPTGISRADTLIRVHWGTRTAHVYGRQLKPDSQVEHIIYDLAVQPQSPWRGFRRRL